MEKIIRAMLWCDEAKQVLRNQKGQGMVEYGLILGLIAIVVIGTLTTMGTDIKALFVKASTGLQNVAP